MKTSDEYLKQIRNLAESVAENIPTVQSDIVDSLTSVLGCPHGRSSWQSCPWCTGLNEAFARTIKLGERLQEEPVTYKCPCGCTEDSGITEMITGDEQGCGETEGYDRSELTHDEYIRHLALDMAIDVTNNQGGYSWPAASLVAYAMVLEEYIKTGTLDTED